MQNLRLRYMLIAICLGMLLPGCGNQMSAPPTSIGAIPAARTHPSLRRAWMDPAASSGDLLYVSSSNDVYAYSYPQGHLAGTLEGFYSPLGECVDSNGDLFVVTLKDQSGSSSIIYEYAHGGTEPIATLNDPAGAGSCAIDPTTGNLAVANWADSNNPYGHYADVAIYAGARGNPTIYYSSEFGSFGFCGYDPKGNLYLTTPSLQSPGDQDQLVRLRAGHSSFDQISLNVTLYAQGAPASVQWDGKYMTVSSDVDKEPTYLYRLRISGDSAMAVETTMLSSKKNTLKSGQILIQGKRILGADYFKGRGGIDSWRYPKAQKPRSVVPNASYFAPFGIAVSGVVSP